MPKILVADDNSNIQKMVGLALKDQGIDVVAVGNGEAAVRKIADVRPDLVLADVFMPVRNGYEVCQFVKMDSSLSHIPVILLVGAFDPLDEQEAQRVGADGVLKKPFIPPDPLISMVKSALQRSGSGPVSAPAAGANPGKFDEPAPFGTKEMPHPVSPSMPTVAATPVQEFNLGGSPEALSESFVEDVPPRPEPIQIDSGSQPVAFGSLLETPAETAEAAEDESSFTTASSPEFAMEHDWRDRDEEGMDAEEEEEEEPAAWRPEGTADEAEVPAAKTKSPKSSANDWRMGGFEVANKSRSMGWEPEEETPAAVETVAPAAGSRAPQAPAPMPLETVSPAASTRAPEIPATPPPAPVKPVQPVQEPAPVASKPFVTETFIQPTAPIPPPLVTETRGTETAAVVVEDKPKAENQRKPELEKSNGKDSWFSVSSSPWESEIQKASQLASTWDAPTVPAPKNGNEKASDAIPETAAVIEEAALPPATVEAIREEAAQVADAATFILETPETAFSEAGSFYAREEDGAREANGAPVQAQEPAPPPTPAPNMDDLVARVLAKMNPEVLQAVTREILKPVVEAMVKEELKSKKS